MSLIIYEWFKRVWKKESDLSHKKRNLIWCADDVPEKYDIDAYEKQIELQEEEEYEPTATIEVETTSGW